VCVRSPWRPSLVPSAFAVFFCFSFLNRVILQGFFFLSGFPVLDTGFKFHSGALW
jgi:hypothetical protein